MIIEGKYNTAVVYAKVIEEVAVEQIRTVCDQEFSKGSVIRVMPDVHAGKGCTIGMTMTVTDKVVPNIVGVDIGCGMYTVNIGKTDIDFEKLDEVAHFIPSGKRIWDGRRARFDLTVLKSFRCLKDSRYVERSIGTLGGGNHFIEVDVTEDGTKYLVIHSGSRNLGKQVCEYYQKLAKELHQGKEEYFKKRDAMIAEYKAAGRRKELQAALKTLTCEVHELTIPEDLCYLYGDYVSDYLFDVSVCQQYASLNRETMADIIIEKMGWKAQEAFHTVHNYIDVEEKTIRKGSIAAHKGEKVLIPINMRDGSILAVGKGNADWNYSAPHGAGRVLSRGKAKETLTMEEYKKEMAGVYTTSVNKATLDESPMAYKSLSDIIDVVRESVDVIEIMKPVYNFKAGEEKE